MPIYKNRKAIFLAFAFLLLENIAGMHVFDMLSNISANYRHQFEIFVNNELVTDQKPASTSTIKMIEGPNGTKECYVEVYECFAIQARAHAYVEHFDYAAYIQHIVFWTNLENAFELIRNLHEIMTYTTVIALCVILGLSLKPFRYYVTV